MICHKISLIGNHTDRLVAGHMDKNQNIKDNSSTEYEETNMKTTEKNKYE